MSFSVTSGVYGGGGYGGGGGSAVSSVSGAQFNSSVLAASKNLPVLVDFTAPF